MSDFTKFHDLIKSAWDVRKQKAELEVEKKKLNAKLAEIEGEIEGILEENDLKSYKSPMGTVGTTTRFSVKLPASPDDKQALYEWIQNEKGKDVLEGFLTINSQTLNKFYNEEVALAAERGEVLFNIPGLQPPTGVTRISYRGFKDDK
jgi:hypothetical protein